MPLYLFYTMMQKRLKWRNRKPRRLDRRYDVIRVIDDRRAHVT